MEKLYIFGQTIRFRLDGHPHAEGTGTVIGATGVRQGNCVEVKLTTNCKEFVAGDIILVGREEIID